MILSKDWRPITAYAELAMRAVERADMLQAGNAMKKQQWWSLLNTTACRTAVAG
jgi:hypothetical protein